MSSSFVPVIRPRCCVRASTLKSHCRPLRARQISTTPTLSAIPPESPRFVHYPDLVQPIPELKAPIKGTLPVSRNILPFRKQYKASTEWLERAAPEPKRRRRIFKGPEQERLQFKQRLAEGRRGNLKQGMTELYSRTVMREERDATKSERDALTKLKALEEPEANDEVWTGISVPQEIRDALEQKDNRRFESEESKAARKADYEARVQAKEQAKLDNIHSLYLHARSFITKPEQLTAKIEEVFGADDAPITWDGTRQSVWSLGRPVSPIHALSRQTYQDESQNPSEAAKEQVNKIMQQRMMKIAGRLTGGRMDIPEDLTKTKADI